MRNCGLIDVLLRYGDCLAIAAMAIAKAIASTAGIRKPAIPTPVTRAVSTGCAYAMRQAVDRSRWVEAIANAIAVVRCSDSVDSIA